MNARLDTPGTPATELGEEPGRVLVLGFDGADAGTVRSMIEAGRLPNLARLAQQGTFAPLRSTHPAESAAGWAALNTGRNPAKNGVASFVVRGFPYGPPSPAMGHVETVDRSFAELELPAHLGLLARTGTLPLAAGSFVVCALVLLLGLRRHRRPAVLALCLSLAALLASGTVWLASTIPPTVPGVFRPRLLHGGFWEDAAAEGVPSIVLGAALAFGRPAVEGARVLGGLGLPDVRGGLAGEWFLYTTDEREHGDPPRGARTASGSGIVFRVDEAGGRIETRVWGPRDFVGMERLRRELEALSEADVEGRRAIETQLRQLRERPLSQPMTIERDGDRLDVTLAGVKQNLYEGEWSDWFHVSFDVTPLVSVHAITRARVLSLANPLTLYLGPLEFDPARPTLWQPPSQPPSFSGDLVHWIGGPFETVGWACMTNPVKDERLPVDVFLEDIEFTSSWRKALVFSALARDDWRLFFAVFSTPDRVQHMTYKYLDEGHPGHDAQEARRLVSFLGREVPLADVIPTIYEEIDAIVGRVMDEYLRPEDTLILCADHGFSSFRRGMHVNNWLAEHGYLTLAEGLRTARGDLGSSVDWSRTRAYALGLGMIFLNLEGREPEGIVTMAEAPALLRELSSELLGAADDGADGTQVRVLREAVVVPELYPGAWGGRDYVCADLMLGFAENYRVSWETAAGKLNLVKDDSGVHLGELFADNDSPWCGDHASVSPEVVPGIFFSSRPVELPPGGAHVLNVAPTVLSLLGVPVPEDYDATALPVRR